MDSNTIGMLSSWIAPALVVVAIIWVLLRVRRIEVRRARFEAEVLTTQKKQTEVLERVASLLEQKSNNV
jgi:hypothetical protein